MDVFFREGCLVLGYYTQLILLYYWASANSKVDFRDIVVRKVLLWGSRIPFHAWHLSCCISKCEIVWCWFGWWGGIVHMQGNHRDSEEVKIIPGIYPPTPASGIWLCVCVCVVLHDCSFIVVMQFVWFIDIRLTIQTRHASRLTTVLCTV